MSDITDWYGQNNINWGKSYSESWWGSVNEANSWGLIYPASAEGSIVFSDSTTIKADATLFTADIGTDSYDVDDTPALTGNQLSVGFTLTGGLIPYWFGNQDHTYYTAGASLLGQVIATTAASRTLTLGEAKQIAGWFSGNSNMTIDTWYDIESKFKVVETEADPDTVIHNMTDITGAQVKYIVSPVSGHDYVVLIKGGTHSPKSSGGRQILTVGEAWNDRDIIKYT